MLVLLLLPQLLQFSARGWAEGHAFRLSSTWLLTIRHTRDILPSGLTAHIFLLTGTASLAALAGLLVLAGIIFLLLLRQLRAVYQGEIYSEGYVVRRELIVRPGWQLPAVDSLTSAIMEKELRYLRQNSRLLLQLISMPVIFLLLMFNGPARKFSFATQPAGLLAGLAGFLLLSLPNVAYNIFGMENQAFGRWLLSPIPLRKVLLTKNMIHGGILTLLYGLVAIFVFAIGHVDLLQVATVTAGFFAGLILQLGAGNLFSVYWPKRVDLAQMSSRMTSSTAGFTSLLIILPFTAVYGMAIFAAKFWHLPWLPLALSLATLAVELKLYSYVLNRTVDYTYDHIEEIAGNLNT
jgi:hypothetical protein